MGAFLLVPPAMSLWAKTLLCSVTMLGETSGRLELGHSKYGVEGVEREIG